MISSTTRRGKAAGWTALISGLCALAGVAVNGYLSLQEQRTRTERDAFHQVQLENSWELLQGAIIVLREDARLRDQDLDRLREAVAELRGAFGEMHRHRAEHALRGGAVDRLLERPERGRGEVKMRGGKRDLELLDLPVALPPPEPARVQAAVKVLDEAQAAAE